MPPGIVERAFQDTGEGLEVREKLLRGEEVEGWVGERGNCETVGRMMRYKEGPGGESLAVRERRFGQVLKEITRERWERYWSKKAGGTSGGKSGVRPDMVKALDKGQRELYRRLYNVCLQVIVMPDQWRFEVIVQVEKKAGARRMAQQRPLKLMEVMAKAVNSEVKEGLREVLEACGLLYYLQYAFRQNTGTQLAALTVVGMCEDAVRYKKELHFVMVDIRKAYDSVVRVLGKGGALRRMGVPLKVVEWLMEGGRRTRNEVKTLWSILVGEEVGTFEAMEGFVQGAAESPLLWIVFYDMVLVELERRGVGRGVCSDIG